MKIDNLEKAFEYKDINWNSLLIYQTFDYNDFEFFRLFSDKINWDVLSKCVDLKENFINEFKDKVNWNAISYWDVSDKFIDDHFMEINVDFLNVGFFEKHKNCKNIHYLMEEYFNKYK